MSGGGSFGRQRSSSKSGPWAGVQPYLRDVYQQARTQYYGPEQTYYPGQTYADLTPTQQQGLYDLRSRAAGGTAQTGQFGDFLSGALQQGTLQDAIGSAGSAIDPSAMQALSQTAQGQSLTGNPYLDQQYQLASRNIGEQFSNITSPDIAATFGGAGRTGGGLHLQAQQAAQGELAQQLGDVATNIYGGNYQLERQRQLEAARQLGSMGLAQGQLGADIYGRQQQTGIQAGALVPTLADLQYGDIDQLMRAGGIEQQQQQRGIDEAMARHYFRQNAPTEALARYANIIQGLMAQSSRSRASGFDTSGYGGVAAGS